MSLKRWSERDVTIPIQAERTQCPGLGSDSRPCRKVGRTYKRRVHNAESLFGWRRKRRKKFECGKKKKALVYITLANIKFGPCMEIYTLIPEVD